MSPIRTAVMLQDVATYQDELLAQLEARELETSEIFDLFQGLVDAKLIGDLPRRYRDYADALIERGVIVPTPATLAVA